MPLENRLLSNKLLEKRGIIDPHLHLFDLQSGHYHWLKSSQAPYWSDKDKIARNVSEQDLTLADNMVLQGFVHIEAGFDNQQPWREIDWLETNCQLPFKSVACADLCSAQFPEVIEQLSQRSSMVGIRHILDDDACSILSHSQINQHFAYLADLDWSFDAQLALCDTAGVDALLKLIQQFPSVKVIINHAGWPPELSQLNQHQVWLENLHKLSEYPNVAIKMSGWEMTNRHWTASEMADSIAKGLAIFGTERVMLASNFPLCTFSHSYAELWQIYQRELALPTATLQQLCANNAARWYKLDLE